MCFASCLWFLFFGQLLSLSTWMILFYCILDSITDENFAVNLIVIPLGMISFALLQSRIQDLPFVTGSSVLSLQYCMNLFTQSCLIYLCLCFMILHLQIYKFALVLDIFSAITSLNIGSLSFIITPSHFILHITQPFIHLPL